jgi:hypothetical protein
MRLETAIEQFPDIPVIQPSKLYKAAKTSVGVSHQMVIGVDAKPMLARLHGHESTDEKVPVIVVYDRAYALKKLHHQFRDLKANLDRSAFIDFMAEVYDVYYEESAQDD